MGRAGGAAVNNLKVYIEYLNKGLETVQSGLGTIDQGLRKIGQSADALDAKLRRVDQTLAGWQRTASLLAGAGIGGLGILISEGLKVKSTFEDIEAGFETMLKSSEKAKALMAEVVKFTAQTPFQLGDVASSAQALLTWGEAADQVTNRLRIMGDVAAIKKVPLIDVINALEKLRTTGNWESEQLVRAGITAESLKGYIEFDPTTGLPAGKGAAAGQKKFEAAMKYLEDFYGGGMQRVMGNLSGLWSNFKDKITLGLKEIGDAVAEKTKEWATKINERLDRILDSDRLKQGVARAFQLVFEQLEPFVDRGLEWLDKLIGYLEQNPQALVDGMRTFVGILKDLVAVVLTLTAARGLLALITAFTTIAGLLGGGIGGAIGVVVAGAGLIALFRLFREMLDGTNTSVGKVATGLDKLAISGGNANSTLSALANQTTPALNRAMGDLFATVDNVNHSLERGNDLFSAFSRISPELAINIGKVNTKLGATLQLMRLINQQQPGTVGEELGWAAASTMGGIRALTELDTGNPMEMFALLTAPGAVFAGGAAKTGIYRALQGNPFYQYLRESGAREQGAAAALGAGLPPSITAIGQTLLNEAVKAAGGDEATGAGDYVPGSWLAGLGLAPGVDGSRYDYKPEAQRSDVETAATQWMDQQRELAKQLVTATEAEVRRLQRKAELTGDDQRQEILETQAAAYLEIYVNNLQRFIDAAALDRLAASFDEVTAANEELAGKLRGRMMDDARRQLDVAKAEAQGDPRYAKALQAEGLIENAEQAMDDLANATDAPQEELYALQSAVLAALTALYQFAAGLDGLDEKMKAALEAAIAGLEAQYGGGTPGAPAGGDQPLSPEAQKGLWGTGGGPPSGDDGYDYRTSTRSPGAGWEYVRTIECEGAS